MENKNWNYKVIMVGDLNEKLIDFKGADKEKAEKKLEEIQNTIQTKLGLK